MELINDLPSGPLDIYRKRASFDWKKMLLHVESAENIKIANEAYQVLEEDPVFQISDHGLTLEEERRLTLLRMKKLYNSKIFYPDDFYFDVSKSKILNSIIGCYDWSLLIRKGLLKDLPLSALFGLGTDRHIKFISALLDLEVGFAFCLTEIAHGTNTKGMRTEARYDRGTESFIIHTPDFEAAKCWAGCLGKTATHGVVFAQLYTSDGTCHGLHCFVVPIRDPRTLRTYPGVTVFDMGPKLGLNGVDNGVMMLNHVSIPRENLLNRTGDVTPEGVYVSQYRDPNKRFGAAMGSLSVGRVSIVGFCVVNLRKALTIALRYSAVRKQFGPDGEAEIPIIEYPLQQWRLFPYLASLYLLNNFSVRLRNYYMEFSAQLIQAGSPDLLARFGQEIHALSCVAKPLAGWLSRDAIQECREACGGHGYLKASGLGQLRDDNDANCTYEGDNNVLLQQTSNWLLSIWGKRKETLPFPMGTVDFFLKNLSDRLLSVRWSQTAFQSNLCDDEILDRCVEAYEWLVCWLCQVTSESFQKRLTEYDPFTAKNKCQIFRAHSLALAFGERLIISWFRDSISAIEQSLQLPMRRLCTLFALMRLLRHVPLMAEGGFLSSHGSAVGGIHGHVERLLEELLPDAVALIDVFAPPDFVLRSALGNADGKVYDHLYQTMTTAKGALTRDPTIQQIGFYKKSKL